MLSANAAALSLWINRALETLWLLTLALVPLAFLDRDYVVSEALIAYVEVPKIALLRTLVALMAVLWLIEWAIQGRLPLEGLFSGRDSRFLSTYWLRRLRGWLQERPSRWLFLAVWFFLGSTLLSTVFSGSLNVSLWGEVPGQDGYPAYTIIAYVLLFAVIATHLKTKVQLWRLIGAMVTMGTLVSGYAILQHYGHDFLNLTEQSGGGTAEVAAIMGNSLFAGATLMMVVPMTLVAAVLSVGELRWTPGWSWNSLRPITPSLAVLGLLIAALTIQLLGITFTFARGPWVGMIVALAGFLGLALFFAGWRIFLRTAVILGLTVVLAAAMLHGLGSISILGLGPWLGVLIALAGFLALPIVYANPRIFGQVVLGAGLVVALAVVIILALSWFKGDDRAVGLESGPQASGAGSTAGAVAERFSTIRGDVLGGFATGRATHWSGSWQLIKDRPWFDFDSLRISWLRSIVGYGPDLFRYTYLLESPSEGPGRVPLEPDHAHNFFIHQTVEQGLLGLLSSLGLFAAALFAGGYLLFRRAGEFSLFQKLILIGLVVTLGGRLMEMMVGVARVSDLTILWVLLAALAALPGTMETQQTVPEKASSRRQRRRSRPQPEANPGTRPSDRQLFWRLAVVAWLIGGIAILTWVKGINNVRAAVEVGSAVESFQKGDYQTALADLDRAIELAPDVSVYYNHKAAVYVAYQRNPGIPPEDGCTSRDDLPYEVCLAINAHESNLKGAGRRPLYYRSRMALAHSAYKLKLDDEVVRQYEDVLALVPDSWKVRDELADAYLEVGKAGVALKMTLESIAITGDSELSGQAYFLQGRAHRDLGDLDRAAVSLERSLELGVSGESGLQAGQILAEAYVSLDQPEPAAHLFFQVGEVYWNRVTQEQAGIAASPSGAAIGEADDFKGVVTIRLVGDLVKTTDLLERSLELGLSGDLELKALEILPQAYMSLGEPALTAESFFRLGDAYRGQGKLDESAQAFEQSLQADTSGVLTGKAHQALAEVYTKLGRANEAEKHWQQTGR